ncbi:Uu.00g095240.m01.CDS01 [Anthostomella pinea]|uniref:Uu.00g095240.m01.CDS01 n=1 Tax=Anthostomella pinea TaxID=933095 RepID=A0AAI8VTP2_9PEZI|nr:Uu.00g095240.m01.CDS01 [Anthostomella pinea]
MATFHPFNRFPIELRQAIWDVYLDYECNKGRLVLLLGDARRVRPTEHLRSPLLSVNRESRDYALKMWYTVALPVFPTVPIPLEWTEIVSSEIMSDFWALHRMVNPTEVPGDAQGTIHISPTHDTFLLVDSIDWAIFQKKKLKTGTIGQLVPERRITGPLPLDVCAKILKSMDVYEYCIDEQTGRYTDENDERFPEPINFCQLSIKDLVAKYEKNGMIYYKKKFMELQTDGQAKDVWKSRFAHSSDMEYR